MMHASTTAISTSVKYGIFAKFITPQDVRKRTHVMNVANQVDCDL